ncbi:hypothetical protein GGQ67_003648 [Rhizobium metallidurans]|uniref:Uncharacterized protein n=1 Tax=Rhizobium metallidurans TaxID=1265931 RepID=A0A7W6GCC0_9HYPH|nr:hypothetical protein [Rhizobium metallidurans]
MTVLLTMTLSSCGADLDRIKDAGRRQGVVNAGINIGPQPAECGADTPHAPLIPGESKLNTLDRERGQVDKANASKRRCFDFNNNQAAGLKSNSAAR